MVRWMRKSHATVTVGEVEDGRGGWVPQLWFAAKSITGKQVWLSQGKNGRWGMTDQSAAEYTPLGRVELTLTLNCTRVQRVELGHCLDCPHNAKQLARNIVGDVLGDDRAAVEWVRAHLAPLWRRRRRR